MNKFFKLAIFGLAAVLFGCQQAEISDPDAIGGQPMKTVTISAGMGADDTKASVDSQTGAFSWQSGDLISVLATDGKFYDFILSEGAGNREAVFEGNIPETAFVTTVATYPRIVANGADNTVLAGNTLEFVLPAEWTYAPEVSNVPMVAVFGEDAEHMSFKQVGGVIRFPVANLPKVASFVVTMSDKTITGKFPVDITALGEAAMVAGTEPSVLTINYSSSVDGGSAEFNVPVPTGVYNNFTVAVKDAEGTVLFSKDYSAENTVSRRTLLNMSEVTLPERPVEIAEVWPYFVDARVVVPTVEGVTKYAVYVDGATEPVIKDVEMVNGKSTVVAGGNFVHNTSHTVAVAKVVDGAVLAETKSAAVRFATANVFQLTQNTGTKFVSVGWDDVAIGWGPKYDGEKWTAVSKGLNPDGTAVHYKRGYQVQLLAADKTTVLYDLVPFAGHEAFTGTFSDSSWLGRVDGNNILIPTALSFGYLEPGAVYYFRVKTLEETVNVDVELGNHNDGSASYPYPYPIYSERGGSAWSELVKVTTDPAHVASEYEVLYQGFDDLMVSNDYMNWAPGVVPDVNADRQTWDAYLDAYPAGFETFLGQTHQERKWTTMAFSKMISSEAMGIIDPWASDVERVFNEKAGSLAGWSLLSSSKETRTVYPDFGTIRLGQSGSSASSPVLSTPVINSDKLSDDATKPCRITANVGYTATSQTVVPTVLYVKLYRETVVDGEPVMVQVGEKFGMSVELQHPEEFAAWFNPTHASSDSYQHHQRFYELTCELDLKNGDVLKFDRPSSGKGLLIIGDIKVEVIPDAVVEPDFNDNGVGTAPDNTDYDVYGLGKMPISYWWTIPDYAHNYDDAKTRELYAEMADAGINIVLHNGEVTQTVEENKRIMNIAGELGMKFIGQVWAPTEAERIAAIREHLADSPYYVGEYIADEPSAAEFDRLGQFTKDYLAAFPEKEIYINIFPSYAKPNQTGTATYEEHVDQYLAKIPSKSMSFDQYSLNSAAGSLGNSYYTNLDLVRSKTLDKRMPFWMITQAGKVGKSTRMPSEKEERWNVWSALAAGSKGIAYFCYWDPWSSETDPDADVAMISREGQKKEKYEQIKKINSDIETIGKKLLPCHADGIMLTHTAYYPLFDNNGAGRSNYGPVKAFSGNTSIGVGCFRDARVSENGENYKGYKVMTVSQMPCRDSEAYLTLDPSVSEITVTHCNTTQTLQVNNTLNATVGAITVSFDGAKLIVAMPEGEAALIEF